MKKLFLILIILTAAGSAGFAGDISFAFEDARFHSDLLGGFAPVYIRAGIDYTGLELIDSQRTDLYVIGGGALVSESIWTGLDGLPFLADAVANNTDDFDDENSYSRWQTDFSMKLKQGFIHEEGREKALLAAYGKYAITFTSPHENWGGGTSSNFLDGLASAYPDQDGTVTNLLQAGIELDRLDKGDVYDGFNVDASIQAAPRWLANSLYGDSNFMQLDLTAKGYYSLLELKRKDSELTGLGIYLADRVQVDYLIGDAVPQYYQENPALGTKMRGFERMSMGTEFTIVNNFDIRLYGIEFVDNINPVAVLFWDTGYYAGDFYNTDYNEAGLRMSTGFELALNIVDFAQVGYRFGFPLIGENLQQESMQSGIMFMYQF
ncbi:MAG: hypothetical protein PQJ61_02265 [Spirochaetales bacterium]|uniref:Bacterial surface antigen (D15) domain-containing protein n=1 Tax=Candidatus Thalassospirochaeta sargassi TaxID=3119039 RepID=A0AAJ1IAF6_9SPIO|nr:hypothetical protein [Spirochaetales bacterium]